MAKKPRLERHIEYKDKYKYYVDTIDLKFKERIHYECQHWNEELPLSEVLDFKDYSALPTYKDPLPLVLVEILYDCIDKLPERKQVIARGYLEGKSQCDIAKELGITQSSVSLAWHGYPKHNYKGLIEILKGLIKEEVAQRADEFENDILDHLLK